MNKRLFLFCVLLCKPTKERGDSKAAGGFLYHGYSHTDLMHLERGVAFYEKADKVCYD